MKHAGWPRPPLVLGYILGVIMENALQIASQNQGWSMLGRPIVLIIIVLVVLTLLMAWRRFLRNRTVEAAQSQFGDAADKNDWLSLLFDVLLLGVFVYAIAAAIDWRASSRLFPMVIALPAIPLLLIAISRDWIAVRTPASTAADGRGATLARGAIFFGCLVAILLAMFAIGQFVALLLFVVLYLSLWARMGWRMTVVYTAASAVFLYGLFNWLVPVQWYESPFFSLFS